VQRQYTGTAGRIENARVAVYLGYAAQRGHALIDRELYLPKSWTGDPARCQAAGIPGHLAFATKPQLARRMIERAVSARVPFAWVAADEAYGDNGPLRTWLEQQHIAHVLAIARRSSRPARKLTALWRMADDGRADCHQDRRFHALVLLATFASLRWGEVTALRRCDLDLDAGTVRVRAAFVERSTDEILLGPPKSRAGRRVVGIPKAIITALRDHLAVFVKPDAGALVFAGAKGGPMRATSTRCRPGRRPCGPSGPRAYMFMIFGTPATPSPRRAAPGSRI
jgi:integrase